MSDPQGKQIQSVRQKRRIEATLQDIELPNGMFWLEDGTIALDKATNPNPTGYTCGWITFLIAPGPDRDHYYAKGFRIGWLTESADPGHIRDRVEQCVRDFEKDIAAGKVPLVESGDLISDECIFNDAAH